MLCIMVKDWREQKKQIRTVEEHKIPELVRAGELLTKTLQGLGFLQTPQQQQNTQINIGTQQTKDIINIDSQEIKQGIDRLHDNLVKSIEME